DAVEPPIDLEVMAVGIEELHRDLDTGAPAAFEHDRHAMLAQALASMEDFVQRIDLERHVVQLALFRWSRHRADERDAMMVRVAAHEHHATRHHLLGIDIRYGEAQDPGIESDGLRQVPRPQNHMADLAD